MKERFTTHNAREYKNRAKNKVPLFSNHDARNLRHAIETNSPQMIDKNAKYTDIYLRLNQQIAFNKSKDVKIEQFAQTQ